MSQRFREERKGPFVFCNDIPDELQPELEKYLIPLAWLVPGWCQSVRIHWSDESEGTGAICSRTSYEYRWVGLTFYPAWHTQDEPEKREGVIHELIHAFACPLADYARTEIERLLPENEAPKYRAAVLEGLRRNLEAFVQDMAHVIHKHLTT